MTKLHIWFKLGDDWSNGATCILLTTFIRTDRQTDKQMKGQSEIAYLPKFADLYVKLKLEFLIASPICHILSC